MQAMRRNRRRADRVYPWVTIAALGPPPEPDGAIPPIALLSELTSSIDRTFLRPGEDGCLPGRKLSNAPGLATPSGGGVGTET